jgi:hypothetical protein
MEPFKHTLTWEEFYEKLFTISDLMYDASEPISKIIQQTMGCKTLQDTHGGRRRGDKLYMYVGRVDKVPFLSREYFEHIDERNVPMHERGSFIMLYTVQISTDQGESDLSVQFHKMAYEELGHIADIQVEEEARNMIDIVFLAKNMKSKYGFQTNTLYKSSSRSRWVTDREEVCYTLVVMQGQTVVGRLLSCEDSTHRYEVTLTRMNHNTDDYKQLLIDYFKKEESTWNKPMSGHDDENDDEHELFNEIEFHLFKFSRDNMTQLFGTFLETQHHRLGRDSNTGSLDDLVLYALFDELMKMSDADIQDLHITFTLDELYNALEKTVIQNKSPLDNKYGHKMLQNKTPINSRQTVVLRTSMFH